MVALLNFFHKFPSVKQMALKVWLHQKTIISAEGQLQLQSIAFCVRRFQRNNKVLCTKFSRHWWQSNMCLY